MQRFLKNLDAGVTVAGMLVAQGLLGDKINSVPSVLILMNSIELQISWEELLCNPSLVSHFCWSKVPTMATLLPFLRYFSVISASL